MHLFEHAYIPYNPHTSIIHIIHMQTYKHFLSNVAEISYVCYCYWFSGCVDVILYSASSCVEMVCSIFLFSFLLAVFYSSFSVIIYLC